MAASKPWTRDELLIALNVYEKLPFGKLHSGNPLIKLTAEKLGRSPSSLAMKLVNLASLDPVITSTGRTGLPGASRLDQTVWADYSANREALVPESEALYEALVLGENPERANSDLAELRHKDGPTDRKAEVRVRLGQNYFRQAVLGNFNGRCGVTGLPVAKLLRASHIIPWNVDVERRLDPTNGLALSALHDAAFDQGLITFDAELRLIVGKTLRDHYSKDIVIDAFRRYEGKPLNLDLQESRRPCAKALEYHQAKIFQN